MTEKNLYAHHHRSDIGREDLAGEHRLGDIVQLIFLILFLLVWSLDSFLFRYSTFPGEFIPWYVRWPAGIAVLTGAFLFARSGLRIVFNDVRPEPHVITTGVFSYVRHPIYLGAILMYLGMILSTFSLISAALWIVIIVFYRFISGYEEKLMVQKYGDSYIEYQSRVPMLFPRFPGHPK
jgi:protein-S-isoprenylcysteine O-methyltransferase Ste14